MTKKRRQQLREIDALTQRAPGLMNYAFVRISYGFNRVLRDFFKDKDLAAPVTDADRRALRAAVRKHIAKDIKLLGPALQNALKQGTDRDKQMARAHIDAQLS